MLQAALAFEGAKPANLGVVTLSGEAIVSTVSAGMRINTDGTVDSRRGSGPTYAQIDGATDWIIPNSAASLRTFHVRLDIVESNMHAGSDLMNEWIELSQNREWWHIFSGLTRNGTLRISDDGGATDLDSAAYSFQVP